jgi:endo-1,4-beta-D-glucanase Y
MVNFPGMKGTWLCFCLLFLFHPAMCQKTNHPYPSQISYSAGSIKVSKWSQPELNKITADFFEKWKSVHVKNDCTDKTQYYVFDNEKKETKDNANTICVSEGQGYGMIIMVFMAGFEGKAQLYYDGMFRFYRAHPSENSPYLMSWSILKGCKVNKAEGNNTAATDGDLDIAFSLLLADAQWGSDGLINYKMEALQMLGAIKELEINTEKQTIKLCDDFEINEKENNDIRSSDFMPDHLREFYRATQDSTWLQVLNRMYTIFRDLQNNYSPATGLLPDFIQYTSNGYKPARPNYLESDYDGHYYYNACRVPLRLATDFLLFNDNRAKEITNRINEWIEKRSKNDPDAILSGYHLNGFNIKNNDYTTLAFFAPLTVSLMVNNESQEWLDDMFESLITKKFSDYRYFDNTINLLSLLVLSGNYWTPSYFETK